MTIRCLYCSSGGIIIAPWRYSMEYMTLKEAGEKWGVSPRRVNYYCAAGRIPGAVKMATIWLIPKQAVKPPDGRRKRGDDENGEKNSAG